MSTFSCSAVITSTVTLVFGSSLKSELSNSVVISPTLRVPKSSIVEGTVVSEPCQMRPGRPSHFTSIFWPGVRRPTSGSSTKARSLTLERSASWSSNCPGET